MSSLTVTGPVGSVASTTVYVSVVVVPSSVTASAAVSATAGVLGSVSTSTPAVWSSASRPSE